MDTKLFRIGSSILAVQQLQAGDVARSPPSTFAEFNIRACDSNWGAVWEVPKERHRTKNCH